LVGEGYYIEELLYKLNYFIHNTNIHCNARKEMAVTHIHKFIAVMHSTFIRTEVPGLVAADPRKETNFFDNSLKIIIKIFQGHEPNAFLRMH